MALARKKADDSEDHEKRRTPDHKHGRNAAIGCARTIDFRATADTGQIVYIDVKTIKPRTRTGGISLRRP